MKRRDFIERGSLALGAIAASDVWLGAVVQGGTPKMPDIFGTYFGIGKEEMTKLLGRYSGYRLSELFRFRALAREAEANAALTPKS